MLLYEKGMQAMFFLVLDWEAKFVQEESIVSEGTMKKKLPITALILCAGASSRMGFPKALLGMEGKTILERHLEIYQQICQRIIVVTGANADQLRPFLSGCIEVHNQNWATTEMRHSILLGIADISKEERILLTPIDNPPASVEDICTLATYSSPVCAGFQGRPGHPALLDCGWLKEKAAIGPLNIQTMSIVSLHGERLFNLNRPEDVVTWEKNIEE